MPFDFVDVTIEDYAFLRAHLFKYPIDFLVLKLPVSYLKILHSFCGIEKLLLKTHHFLGLSLQGF